MSVNLATTKLEKQGKKGRATRKNVRVRKTSGSSLGSSAQSSGVHTLLGLQNTVVSSSARGAFVTKLLSSEVELQT